MRLKCHITTNQLGLVEKKWNHKMSYWLRTGEFESKILLHRDFTLADGYSSVKIAYLKGIDKVPVYFID